MTALRTPSILTALIVLGTAAVYSSLPAEVPIHFDLHGRVDATASRAIGALLLPASAVAVLVSLALVIRAREESERGPLALAGVLAIGVLGGLQLVVLRVAMLGASEAGAALGLLLAVASLAMGLSMPRLRRNPVVGIRLPWTLRSDEVWARSHRLGGMIFVAAGVAGLAGASLGMPAVAIAAVAIAAVVTIGASFWIAQQVRLD